MYYKCISVILRFIIILKQIQYDLERVIDDWVMMGFLVGNDFIPHLPNMHIRQDHLPLIYKHYAKGTTSNNLEKRYIYLLMKK